MPSRKPAGGLTPGTGSCSYMLGVDQDDAVGEGGFDVVGYSYVNVGTSGDENAGVDDVNGTRDHGGFGSGAK